MHQPSGGLKKRVEFKLIETLSYQTTIPQNITEEELSQWLQSVMPDATQLITRAEALEAQLQQKWEALGKPNGTITSWLRQEVGISLADSPITILDKAEAYLNR